MTTDARLPREVFLTLAAVGWIDGKLHFRELDAITDAARAEGLTADELADVQRAIREPIEMRDIDIEKLSSADRLYAYAIARWVTSVDGATESVEIAALEVLGHALRLTRKGRDAMDAAVSELALRPEGERPARLDFSGLKRAIAARVEAAAEARKRTEGNT
jgi:uncharacterized membrane protein YebE (DUF533 family)